MSTKPTITSILLNELNADDLIGLTRDELHDLIEAFAGMSSFLWASTMPLVLSSRLDKVMTARRSAEAELFDKEVV